MPSDPSLVIDKGCVLITEAGHHFGCTPCTISKVMLIYHYYRKGRATASLLNRDEKFFHLFSTAAFCLSYQICGEELKMEEVIDFFEKLGVPPEEPSNMKTLKANITKVMFDIHRVVFGGLYRPRESKLDHVNKIVDVSQRFVLSYMDRFASVPQILKKIPAVKTTSLKMLNTFYHCPKCTSYTPLEMAWAAMHISFRLYLIKVEEISILKMELDSTVDKERYMNAMDDMLVVANIAINNMSDATG